MALRSFVLRYVPRFARASECRFCRTVSTNLKQLANPIKATTSGRIRLNVFLSGAVRFHQSHIRRNDIVTVLTPPFVESVTEGDIFFEKEIGTFVKTDDVIAHIETDKITLPVASPADGVIEKYLVESGSRVTPGVPVIEINTSATPKVPEPPSSFKFEKSLYFEPKPEHKPPLPSQTLDEIKPDQPANLMDSSSDAFAQEPTSSSGERRVKISRMRMRIAERLKDSQNTAATLTTLNEVDMSNLISMRKQYGEEFVEKHGIKLGFMSSFVKASIYAIKDQPIVNAYIDGNEIVYRDAINIGVAVASPKGLVVPILRDAQTMSYAEIETAIREMGQKARDGRLLIKDMQEGTFTISNGGIFGGLFGTPIINQFQSAILGMYSIKERPVAINGQVVCRPMMYIALSYDHRLIDGREAVTFLTKVKRYIENPVVSILDL